MDGSFACPECGSSVEVLASRPAARSDAGSATGCSRSPIFPARPMLPGSAGGSHARSGSSGLGRRWRSCSSAILAARAFRFVKRQYDSAQQRSINQLLESSRATRGRWPSRPGLDRSRRGDRTGSKSRPGLSRPARRVGEKNAPTLPAAMPRTSSTGLRSSRPLSFPLGDWLNLIARADKDPDLAPLVATRSSKQFQAA